MDAISTVIKEREGGGCSAEGTARRPSGGCYSSEGNTGWRSRPGNCSRLAADPSLPSDSPGWMRRPVSLGLQGGSPRGPCTAQRERRKPLSPRPFIYTDSTAYRAVSHLLLPLSCPKPAQRYRKENQGRSGGCNPEVPKAKAFFSSRFPADTMGIYYSEGRKLPSS